MVKQEISQNDKEWMDNTYNPKNTLLTRSFVEQTIYDYSGLPVKIKDLTQYQIAFVHKSFYNQRKYNPLVITQDNKNTPILDLQALLDNDMQDNIQPSHNEDELSKYVPDNCYEVLEYLGDSFVGCVVAEYLFDRFPNQSEGFLSKIRSKIVCFKSLAKLGDLLGFKKYLLLTHYAETVQEGRSNSRFMEDVFEAFCGAMIKDQSFAVVKKFVIGVIERYVDFSELILVEENHKDVLQKLFRANGWKHPLYHKISVVGPRNNKVYKVGIGYKEIKNVLSTVQLYRKSLIYDKPLSKDTLDDMMEEINNFASILVKYNKKDSKIINKIVPIIQKHVDQVHEDIIEYKDELMKINDNHVFMDMLFKKISLSTSNTVNDLKKCYKDVDILINKKNDVLVSNVDKMIDIMRQHDCIKFVAIGIGQTLKKAEQEASRRGVIQLNGD